MASSTTRDDAPLYLAKYAERRTEHAAGLLPSSTDPNEPAFVARARHRATQQALAELDLADAPPGRTEAFARESVAPRELQYPESFRKRVAASVDVRLIRHGQTQGYVTDGALTPLGRWQAHRKGQDLAKGLREGMTVKFPHAPTARAQETSQAVRGGVEQALSRYGILDVVLEDPTPNDWFKNFQVDADGKELDVTAAFQEYANILEGYQRSGAGDRPGWIQEMHRFYRTQQAGGDPITIWLTTPLGHFEPPSAVVRRHWVGITELVKASDAGRTVVYMCGHSGPIRAVAATAVGHDPGEPHNTEDVRIKVLGDLEHAIVTYRGRGTEIEIPTLRRQSWCVH